MTHPIVYEDRDVRVSLEVIDNMSFIHCKSYRWNKSIYKKYKELFSVIMSEYMSKTNKPMYACALPDDYKLQKFAIMFGLHKIDGSFLGTDGKLRDIFKVGDK